jgi:hypothetical protein
MRVPAAPNSLLSLLLAHRPPLFRRVLRAVASLEPSLPNAYLAGGCVRNSIWKTLFPDCKLRINDFDIGFYDPLGDRGQELAAKKTLSRTLKEITDAPFDVKNQYSFGRWRPAEGDRRVDYGSVEDGIADWLHTATAVGLRLETRSEGSPSPKWLEKTALVEHEGERYRIYAPYGLEDLFEGVVRPVPAHADSEAARTKGASYITACPSLKLKDA